MSAVLAFCSMALFLAVATSNAQLMVSVSPPRVTGNKAVVKLEFRNSFNEKIESARAVCFLMDEMGKVVGRSTQWVIGGTRERPPLEPGATNRFHFVIATDRPAATNLVGQVTFSRILLEGGKSVEGKSAVRIEPAPK